MKDAGFELRKYHTIDLNLQTTVNKIEKFQPLEDNLKVLEIDWHKQDDSFVIDLSKSYEAGIELPTTKRNVLKIIASIYDLIGIISPVVVLFKILFEKISLLKCDWDSDLNPGLKFEWKKLLNSLKEMTFTVPRFYFRYFNSTTIFDIHAFLDASKPAYGTVIYLTNGESSILVLSKTKVAPIQPVSISCLELLPFLLLAESVISVYQSTR